MSWDKVSGDWPKFRGRFKKTWNRLSDDELDRSQGDRHQLTSLVQERYGMTSEDAGKRLEDWLREPGVLDDWNDRRPV